MNSNKTISQINLIMFNALSVDALGLTNYLLKLEVLLFKTN